MPHARSLRSIALLLLAGAVLAACRRDRGGDAELPAGLKTRAVATTLPVGARVVISGYDVDAFRARLQASRLYQELAAIPDVRQAFAPLAQTQQQFESETGLPLNEETFMTLFGRRFDVGFYGRLPEDRADLLLVADVEDRGRARTILEGLETRVRAEKGVTFRGREIAGASARVATNRQNEEVMFYALEGEHLTIATTEPRLKAALDLAADRGDGRSMVADEAYLESLRKLPDATIAAFIDQQAIREAAARTAADTTTGRTPAEQLQRERLRAATSALGDYSFARSVTVGVYWTENGIRSDIYTRFPEGPRAPLAAMLSRSPGRVRTLAYQPVGTLLYVSLHSLDAQTVYDALYGYAVNATRIQIGVAGTRDSLRADSLVAANLRDFERQTGFDVQGDLVAWIGDEAALSVAGVNRSGFFPIPEVGLTVAARDRERARAFLTRMEAQLAAMARDRASVPLAWQAEEYQGQAIRFAPTPLGEGLSLAYAIDNEFVLVGSSRGLVRRMLDARAGRAQALPSNRDFATMTRFYPQQANLLGFVNLEQILTEVEGLISTYGPMSGASSADTTSPARRVLAALKNAPRMGFFSETDSDGIFGHVLLEIR